MVLNCFNKGIKAKLDGQLICLNHLLRDIYPNYEDLSSIDRCKELICYKYQHPDPPPETECPPLLLRAEGAKISILECKWKKLQPEVDGSSKLPFYCAGGERYTFLSDKIVFISGGYIGSQQRIAICKKLTLLTETAEWTYEISDAAKMNFHRANHGAIKFGQEIYVFGGNGQRFPLFKSEKYNISTDKWSIIPKRPELVQMKDEFIS